jgi:Sensors of blue-light using FAD
MISITYVSSATSPFGDEALLNLVDECQLNNQKLGITGVLVYSEGNFMQVIEGAALVTQSLYERIKLDARHRGVTTVDEQHIQVCEFGGWSMAYNILRPKSLRAPRLPQAFMDRAGRRPLPLAQGGASRLLWSFMQNC